MIGTIVNTCTIVSGTLIGVAEYRLCLPDKQLLQQKMKELFDDETAE
jgi:uncharacterized membrane protein YqgA involved in biofilm formation